MLGGSLAVVVLQAVNFAMLARFLGVAEYGMLATINALASMLIPLAGFGYGSVMLMNVSRDAAKAPIAAGNALLMQFATGLISALLGAAAVVVISATHIPFAVAAIVLVGELVFMRIGITASQLFVALERQGTASAINVAASLVRVASISIAVAYFDNPAAYQWSMVFITLALGFGLTLAWLMARAAGGLELDLTSMRTDLGRGADFSMGTLAKAIYTDADKLILARFASATEVGLYAAAYRIAAMSFMPVRALLDASAARFFREGEAGISSALRLTRKVFRYALPYTVVVGIVMSFAADFVPLIFGANYTDSVPLLRLLALLPVIQAIHYTLADALSGSGYQRLRMLAQATVVAFYIGMALAIIPSSGPTGAAYTCIASECLLAVLISTAVMRVRRREVPKQ
jgi:O-antigen/teichoic acid export membrane protein